MTAIAVPEVGGKPKLLEEMTSYEVVDALTRTDVAIITPSAVEQHGGHLPLGTDWYIGTETTRRTVAKLAERGHETIGYAFPLGISHNFTDFPGSLTLSNSTFVLVVTEIARCLHHQGFRRFVLLSGNGGNGAAMQIAASEIFQTLGAKALFVDALPYQFSYRHEYLKEPGIDHHGAEGETSKILAVHPELVIMEKAVRREANAEALERTKFPVGVKRAHGHWSDIAPYGYVGAPGNGEAKTGEIFYERNSEWITDVIERDYFSEEKEA
jgi:creatinine amidohydrolase